MFEAVHDMTARGLEDFPTKPRHEWVLQWPGMSVLVVSAIYWTRGARSCGTQGAHQLAQGHECCS